jgi:predicted permease
VTDRAPAAVRLYRVALRLLPAAVVRTDGEEMVRVFAEQWWEPRGTASRARLALRTFGRLPAVAMLEWLDVLGWSDTRTVHARRGGTTMGGWGTNLRLALRTLRKAPGFALTTVLLLGLGIGSVTAIFTLVDHVLLRALPYPEADRLVLVENGSHSGVAFREYRTFPSIDLWGAAMGDDASLVGEGDPLKIREVRVSEDFFRLFGARPALGRLLVGDDYAALDGGVLSHGAWVRIFGGATSVLGRTIRVNDETVTVVGVLAEDFIPPEGGVSWGGIPDLWRPIDWTDPMLEEPGYHVLELYGRLAPGVTLATANAEMKRAQERLAARDENFRDREGNPARTPFAGLQELTTRDVRPALGLLLGAVGLLLLVACLNVAHLFLARSLGRAQEMAVRRALGAGMGSLLQQLTVESLLLGGLGGVLGLGLAVLGARALLALSPQTLPWSTGIGVDPRVVAFAAAVSAGAALVFGLLPTLRAMGHHPNEHLKGASRSATAGRGTSRVRNGLVVLEVAVSLVLVAEAGLLVRSFVNVRAHDPGFDPSGVWTVPLTLPDMTTAEYVEAMERVRTSVASIPGVSSASVALTQPLEWTGGSHCCWSQSSLRVDGESKEGYRLWMHPVSAGYFETLAVPMRAGAPWSVAEARDEAWVGVMDESLAIALFGSAERAVNRVVSTGRDETPIRITGVAASVRHYGLDREETSNLYVPLEHLPFAMDRAHVAVRLAGETPDGFARTLREAIWKAAPDLPVPVIRSMQDWVDRSTASRRFDTVLFGAFGFLALLLAAAGLYGTLLYSVGERRRELGIRMALGAARADLVRRVVLRGVGLAAFGSALGLVGSWLASRALASKLYGLGAHDPGTLALAVGVLLAAAFVASWIPARRAGSTDPLLTLREE